MIKRLQLFEFCDMPWMKGVFREGYLDCLNNIHRFWQPYRHIAPLISDWSRRLKAEELLDIGSGGGEQIATILNQFENQKLESSRFILSDIYPNPSTWSELEGRFGADKLAHIDEPVDIANLPSAYQFLTVFSAFHHFPPELASTLLKAVVARRGGICIVEFTRRTWMDLLSMIPAFFMNMLAPFTAKRFRMSKLIWGTLLPVIPFMVTFDGIVSALRSYTASEMAAMLPRDAEKDFVIEQGSVPWGRMPWSKSTYLMLSPKERLVR